jgi:hypothetical protein
VALAREGRLMPLAGTICCQTGEPQDFAYCMSCATTNEPDSCDHPFFLIKAMRDNAKSRTGAGLSATKLMDCDRFHVLSDDYGFDYYESPDDYKARFTGTVIHGGIEKFTSGEPDVISEKRFFRDIEVRFVDDDGEIHGEVFTLSGQMDLIYPHWMLDGREVVKVTDAKSGGSRALRKDLKPLDSHVEQVNIYRWILANGRPEVPEVVTTPTREGDVVTEIDAPVSFDVQVATILYIKNGAMVEVDVPLWPLDETEEHIRGLIADGKGYKLPPILPSRFVKSRSGELGEIRHWKCDRCPLREVCDTFPHEGVSWFSGTTEAADAG